MAEEQEQGQESAAPQSADSDSVQAALQNIPGLAEAVENRKPSNPVPDPMAEEPEPDTSGFGTPKPQVEDSETVQQAIQQLGLQ